MQRPLAAAQNNQTLTARVLLGLYNNKRSLAIIGGISVILYWSRRQGYLQSLLSLVLKKVEQRVTNSLQKSMLEMERLATRTNKFSDFFHLFYERTAKDTCSFMQRYCDVKLGLDIQRKRVEAKGVPKEERTESWKSYRYVVIRSMLFTIIAEAFVPIIWFTKEMVFLKRKDFFTKFDSSSTDEISDRTDLASVRAIETSKQVIESLVEALISKSLGSLDELIESLQGLFMHGLSKKVELDTLITNLQDSRTVLLGKHHKKADKDNAYIDLNYRLNTSKKHKFKLVHKYLLKENISLLGSLKSIFGGIFGSSEMPELPLRNTKVSSVLLTKYTNYSFLLDPELFPEHLISASADQEAHHAMGVISEVNQQFEDQSELHPSSTCSPWGRMPPVIVWDSKRDWQKEEKVMKGLCKEVQDYLNEFLDLATSSNAQILLEYGIKLQIKKFSNRLELLRLKKSSSPEPFLKHLIYLDKILQEEYFSETSAQNDTSLYEEHTKELFIVLKEEIESDGKLDQMTEEVRLSLDVVKESTLSKHLQNSLREFGGRVFFESEYDKYFSDEKGDEAPQAPGDQMQMIASMLGGLN